MSESDVHINYDPVQRMICVFCRARMDVSSIPPFTKATCPSCKSEVTVPARLGAFLLTELLGTGGMGGVYRAHDETLGRDVAIKVMLKSLGDNPEFVSSFRREAQAAAKLNHPNIAQIYSFGQEKGQPYIVMELVPGLHFDEMIAGPEPLDVPLIMKIGHDVAEGLQMAAEANLIHGDIKPENILLDERDQPKLVDFGIAAKPSKGESEIWGTPYYIAPERVRRQRVDFRSDIYCLGGTLYHAITQHPPFEGADAIEVVRARLKGPPVPIEMFRADVAPEVSAIVTRMLQMEPAMRYPTYGSLLSDMRAYLRRVEPRMPGSAAKTGKRFVIRGSKAATTQRLGATTGQLAQTGKLQTGMQTGRIVVSRGMFPDAAPGLQPAEEKRAKPGWVKAVGIVLAVVASLLLLAGAGVWLYFRQEAKHMSEAITSRQAALEGQIQSAKRLHGAILGLEQQAERLVKEGDELIMQAATSVSSELGEEWSDRIVTLYQETVAHNLALAAAAAAPEPEEVVEEAGAEAEQPADGAAAAEVDATEAAPESDAAEVAEATPDGANAAEDGAAAEPVEEEVVELPPLANMARDLFLTLLPLHETLQLAGQSVYGADQIMEELSGGTNTLESVTAAIGRLQRLHDTLAAALEREAPQALKATAERLALLRGEIAELNATRAREAAEAARLAAEQAAAEQAAAAQAAEQAAIQAEVMRVMSVMTENHEALLKHRYSDVLFALRRLERDLERAEGQAALKLALERVSGLQELRNFMIRRLNETPFKAYAGWSVVEANERRLTIRTAAGATQNVLWENVGVGQMAQFIKFYLADEQEARTLRLRERFSQSLNAATYCVIFGDSDAARDMARELLQKAVEMVPSEREHSLLLLPEITL